MNLKYLHSLLAGVIFLLIGTILFDGQPAAAAALHSAPANPGPIRFNTVLNGNEVELRMDAGNALVAMGKFVVNYDSAAAQITDCSVIGISVCQTSEVGTIQFAFVHVNGYSGEQTIATFTFNNANAEILGVNVTMLADNIGNELESNLTSITTPTPQEMSFTIGTV